MILLHGVPFGGQVAERASRGRPMCECGEPGCFPTELPLEAWAIAGVAGAGRGPLGTDLLAVAPGHSLPDLPVRVYERRDGWEIVGAEA